MSLRKCLRLEMVAPALHYSKYHLHRIAFTDIFKAMYKTSPAEFRETENFYPLQLEIYLKEKLV